MMELYHGRPESNEGRLEKEIKVYDFLDEIEVPFVRVDHEAVMTIEACRGIDETLGITINKNLFLCNRQKTVFYLLSMPGEKPFQTKELSHQIGSARLSFAPGEMMEALLHCPPGSASVLGLAYDTEHQVRYLMDREVYESETLGCHPCINLGSMRLKTSDVKNIFLPYTGHEVTVVDL